MAEPSLSGQTFARLLVLEEMPGRQLLVRCECGTERVMLRRNVVRGRSRSCGCVRANNNRSHGSSGTRLYRIWRLMRARCFRGKGHDWHRYGGRGISCSEDWATFEPFRDWALAHGYADELSIDRINNDGNYEPSNCRWVDHRAQCLNKQNTVRIPYRGEMMTVVEVAEITGKSPDWFYWRIRSGRPADEIAAGL